MCRERCNLLFIYCYMIQHIKTRPQPFHVEPVITKWCSQQIVIRTMHINTITVNHHETPYPSLYLYVQYI
jgi:hypothetical protein